MKNNILYYSIGARLYCPANKKSVADSVVQEKFGSKYSLARCLEDTINDRFVEEAEQALIHTINHIYVSYEKNPFYLPKIFVRVRNESQITRLTRAFGDSLQIVTGYILPKFTTENAAAYIQALIQANETARQKLYVMPIYENMAMIDLRRRIELLYELKDTLAPIEDLVLNIRVGGNDLCHTFGFRRHADESIHQIQPISQIFSDIITVYGMDYVVSGPVWEYYNGPGWEKGLLREINDDKLCGFTGKTVIHPNQIPVVNRAYQVSQTDFNDARSILNWNQNANEYVSGSLTKERMNEYKTHNNWAKKTLFMAEAFGIREERQTAAYLPTHPPVF